MNRTKKILILLSALLVVVILGVSIWLYRLNRVIVQSLSEKRFIPPIEFYSSPQKFYKGQKIRGNSVIANLQRLRFRARRADQTLSPGDYMRWSSEECQQVLNENFPDGTETCIGFRNRAEAAETKELQIIAVGAESTIFEVFEGLPPQPTSFARLQPELFAQFVGNEPMLKQMVDLGDAPPLCLNAVLAIEDSYFLEHGGISWKGIGRAFVRNVTAGRIEQGGSTITQQLVKNYFLTSERTLSRKIKEMGMAILLEAHATKDEILQSYINEIYMGQHGPFQVRGFKAASEYYFSKSLEDLDLAECALLAAVVNSPGLFNPFRHPERAIQRRDLVLSKMTELGIIDGPTAEQAKKVPLPKKLPGILSEPAPFFVDAAQRQIDSLKIDRGQGLKVYTTLDLNAQEAAQDSVKAEIERIEKDIKTVRELKAKGKVLEGALIAADPQTGFVQAVVGGRNFKNSQFNRAIQSHRQVGSVMKPFVFLAALENPPDDAPPYNPLTIVNDNPLKIQYEKQKWAPENYGKKYFGDVPLYFALKESLNCATARLALQVGLEPIVELVKDMGVKSPLQALPALSLGAFELYPWEVLQLYSSLARMGQFTPLTYVERVETLDGEELYSHRVLHEQVADKEDVAVLVGMMKQVIESGTGRAIRLWGFNHPAAGKTGTTSDNKDAWFAGFTPLHVAVAWVGYDDNTPHGLTGASGAVPIWVHYMKDYASYFPPVDFEWPDTVEVREIDIETIKSLNVPEDPKEPITPAHLVFRE